MHCEKGPNAFAQADMSRNFSLSLDLLHVKGQFYIKIQSNFEKKKQKMHFYGSVIM